MLGRAARKHATVLGRARHVSTSTPSALFASASAQHPASTLDLLDNETPDYTSNCSTTVPSSSKITLDTPFTERFDWRLRASSRRPTPTPKLDETGTLRVKKTRRVPPPEKDLQPGEEYFDEVNAYRDRFLPLIEAEEAEEEAVFKDRLAAWSLDRLRQQGYTLTGLSAFWLEESHYGLPVANFSLGPGLILPPHHRFEKGTQVLVSRIDPLQEEHVKGSVLFASEDHLRVTFDNAFDLNNQAWRLDLGTSNLVYQRMRDAIRGLNSNPTEQERDGREGSTIQKGTYLRDVLLRSFTPNSTPTSPVQNETPWIPHQGAFSQDQRIQSWAKRHSLPQPLRIEGDPDLGKMNSAQIRAIASMVGERVSLVQGPPGTGKTKTIVEAIRLLKGHFEVPHPIVICTYTNVAVDHLVEGLAQAGLRPLRFGSVQRVSSALLEHTFEHKIQAHHLGPIHEKALAEVKRCTAAILLHAKGVRDFAKDSSPAAIKKHTAHLRSLAQMERRQQSLKKKAYAIRMEIVKDVLDGADVICTTCVSAASMIMDAIDFPIVFLDEASMSTEPASLIPLMKGARHISLIGDHKQLPPVITSREAQSAGFDVSLFERLIREGNVPSVMLDTQYRMHPSLARFPSGEFYDCLLRDGMVGVSGDVPARLSPVQSKHLLPPAGPGSARPSVVFLDHGGNESASDRSRVNWNEAHIVCSVIEDLLLHNEDLKGEDIGVIAPYAAQVSLLTRLFRRDSRYAERFQITLGQKRAAQLAAVEIGTVDGFEGREKEVVVFSTVRNNARGQLGFLADRRRLNVGLTRAKRGLFVVGSLNTLRSGKVAKQDSALSTAGSVVDGEQLGVDAWRRYAEFLTKQGAVVRLSGTTLAEALYGNLPREFRHGYLHGTTKDRWQNT